MRISNQLSAVALTILLLSTTGTILVNSAKANGIFDIPSLPVISINNDGTISPSNMPIKQSGSIYYVTGDISNYCILIERDNVILDGQGFTLSSNKTLAGSGIGIEGANNVTVRNCILKTFPVGISPYGANWGGDNDIKIINNSISGCNAGIMFWYVDNGTITENTIIDSGDGIHIRIGSLNAVNQNTLRNNDVGIQIEDSSNCTFNSNVISNNKIGVRLTNSQYNVLNGNNFTSNDCIVYFFVHTWVNEGPLFFSYNNQFYLNNFVNNLQTASSDLNYSNSNNFWDNGLVGNYWSDYNGTGVYTIDEKNVDHHPFTQQVDITSTEPSPTPTPTFRGSFTDNNATLIGAIIIVTVIAIGAGLLIYFKKRKAN
jgi:parallel beta-helix repeat protein